jgi:hypothetical protein
MNTWPRTSRKEADCDALRLCCPVRQERITLEFDSGASYFRHVAAPDAARRAECESRSPEFSQEYCRQHNTRAQKQRLEFLEWDLVQSTAGK